MDDRRRGPDPRSAPVRCFALPRPHPRLVGVRQQTFARFALVGDVLFQGSVGRTDFAYGDHAALIEAIKTKLLPLGDDMIVHVRAWTRLDHRRREGRQSISAVSSAAQHALTLDGPPDGDFVGHAASLHASMARLLPSSRPAGLRYFVNAFWTAAPAPRPQPARNQLPSLLQIAACRRSSLTVVTNPW